MARLPLKLDGLGLERLRRRFDLAPLGVTRLIGQRLEARHAALRRAAQLRLHHRRDLLGADGGDGEDVDERQLLQGQGGVGRAPGLRREQEQGDVSPELMAAHRPRQVERIADGEVVDDHDGSDLMGLHRDQHLPRCADGPDFELHGLERRTESIA